MKTFLLRLFTWWSGPTVGTMLHTWRSGELVGEDEAGNRYYRTRGGAVDPALGFDRRWVIYAGDTDASRVPPGWNGWLQRTVDVPPSQEAYEAREWQLPHRANMTGTAQAYRPPGSAISGGERARTGGDYEAWSPGN